MNASSMLTRRRLLQLGAGAAVTTGLGLPAAEAAAARNPSGGSAKKGFPVGTRGEGYKTLIADLRVAWYYNWGPNLPATPPRGFEFVPMMWKIYPEIATICTRLKNQKAAGSISHLMGFNEPDHPGQSNLTVADCLKNWPLLMQTGLPLVSPGAAWMWGGWMKEFMAGVKKDNLRVDAISVHWYGNPDPKDFLARIRAAYDLYKKPLWITEFAVQDKGANAQRPNRHSPKDVAAFMKTVLTELEKFDFVERYAWFGRPGAGAHLTSSTIYEEGGKLTDLGKLYASF